MLDEVRMALRYPPRELDIEVQGLIDAALADLALSGVAKIDTTDPLIRRAVVVYCKANFGWDNQDAEKLQRSYDLLKSHLTLSADYRGIVS